MTHQETDWWYKDPHNLMVVVKTVFVKMLVNMITNGKGNAMLKDVRAKNFYNTDFFHTLATVR